MRFTLLSLLTLPFTATAFDYGVVEAGGLQLDDVKTGISEIKTIFKDRKFSSVLVFIVVAACFYLI